MADNKTLNKSSCTLQYEQFVSHIIEIFSALPASISSEILMVSPTSTHRVTAQESGGLDSDITTQNHFKHFWKPVFFFKKK